MKPRMTTERKFWKKVNRQGLHECWLWDGRMAANGTGVMDILRDGKKVTIGVHIYVYDLMIDTVPDGSHVRHTCGNRCCVNPQHLTLHVWGDKYEETR